MSSRLTDPERVRAQYATEANLAARIGLYAETSGLDAREVALAAVAEAAPGSVLEVGCGTGWFAARVRDELGASVVAVDQSERMVELTRDRGIDARVADVQDLPFSGESFDVVAANWMLYHLPDLDAGLREVVHVLRPGGRLVAATNGADHLLELWQLVGAVERSSCRGLAFAAENGEAILRRHFPYVERRDGRGTVRIDDRAAAVRYFESAAEMRDLAERVPESFEPFDARRSNAVFVADL